MHVNNVQRVYNVSLSTEEINTIEKNLRNSDNPFDRDLASQFRRMIEPYQSSLCSTRTGETNPCTEPYGQGITKSPKEYVKGSVGRDVIRSMFEDNQPTFELKPATHEDGGDDENADELPRIELAGTNDTLCHRIYSKNFDYNVSSTRAVLEPIGVTTVNDYKLAIGGNLQLQIKHNITGTQQFFNNPCVKLINEFINRRGDIEDAQTVGDEIISLEKYLDNTGAVSTDKSMKMIYNKNDDSLIITKENRTYSFDKYETSLLSRFIDCNMN